MGQNPVALVNINIYIAQCPNYPNSTDNPVQWQEAPVRSCAETVWRGLAKSQNHSEICCNPSKDREKVDILPKEW